MGFFFQWSFVHGDFFPGDFVSGDLFPEIFFSRGLFIRGFFVQGTFFRDLFRIPMGTVGFRVLIMMFFFQIVISRRTNILSE